VRPVMKLFPKIIGAGVLALPSMFVAGLARAAEEGGSSTGHVLSMEAFKWVHFLIVAAMLYWLFAKVLPETFRRNADNISAAIRKATAAKAEAERQVKEAEAKLATLANEVAQFRSQAQKDAAAELERLRAAIKADAQKIAAAAKAEVEAAERAGRVELKKLAAKLAMDHAETLVAKQLTPGLQEAMLKEFVHRLEGRPN
jgi:F0F1-type ATP synthase membrane subunit b/b'